MIKFMKGRPMDYFDTNMIRVAAFILVNKFFNTWVGSAIAQQREGLERNSKAAVYCDKCC